MRSWYRWSETLTPGYAPPSHATAPRGGSQDCLFPGLSPGSPTSMPFGARARPNPGADPFGFGAETPPRTASRIVRLPKRAEASAEEIAARQGRQMRNRPVSIYEVHLFLGAERPAGSTLYRELAELSALRVTLALRIWSSCHDFPMMALGISADWAFCADQPARLSAGLCQ